MSTPEDTPQFNVYVVYSAKTIDELKEFIKKNSKTGSIGMMHVLRALQYDKTVGRKVQTQLNQALCLLDDDIANSLKKNGYSNKRNHFDDFAFNKYFLHDTNYPRENEKTHELYVAIPKELTIEKARAQLEALLEHFSREEFKVIPSGSYWVTIPFANRITGEHRKKGIIRFNPDVSVDAIAMTRLLLHDGSWKDDDRKHLTYIICQWSRKMVANTDDGDDGGIGSSESNKGSKIIDVSPSVVPTTVKVVEPTIAESTVAAAPVTNGHQHKRQEKTNGYHQTQGHQGHQGQGQRQQHQQHQQHYNTRKPLYQRKNQKPFQSDPVAALATPSQTFSVQTTPLLPSVLPPLNSHHQAQQQSLTVTEAVLPTLPAMPIVAAPVQVTLAK